MLTKLNFTVCINSVTEVIHLTHKTFLATFFTQMYVQLYTVAWLGFCHAWPVITRAVRNKVMNYKKICYLLNSLLFIFIKMLSAQNQKFFT